jgi:hypothetical protein
MRASRENEFMDRAYRSYSPIHRMLRWKELRDEIDPTDVDDDGNDNDLAGGRMRAHVNDDGADRAAAR